MYDCIVIGAGIAGAACARKLAEEAGKKVLVIERRNHVGGNCYDVLDEYGILIHEYGPHIFHTGLEWVWVCMVGDNVTRCLLLGRRFITGEWRKRFVVKKENAYGG